MSTETDWREAARGIPVWEGAAAWFEGKRWRVTRLWPSVDGGEDRASLECLDGSGDGEIPPISDVVPDLADLDTRATYLRRLALAHGSLLELEGHAFDKRGLAWVVYAGWSTETWAWSWAMGCTFSADKRTDDRLMALALAWPTDKRVVA